jgi:hypothetical protein
MTNTLAINFMNGDKLILARKYTTEMIKFKIKSFINNVTDINYIKLFKKGEENEIINYNFEPELFCLFSVIERFDKTFRADAPLTDGNTFNNVYFTIDKITAFTKRRYIEYRVQSDHIEFFEISDLIYIDEDICKEYFNWTNCLNGKQYKIYCDGTYKLYIPYVY